MSLAGKIVLVTNASTSFAFSVARQLGLCGARVLISDCDQRKLEYTMSGLENADIPKDNLAAFVGDTSTETGRKELFEQIAANSGTLDALVQTNRPNLLRGNIMRSSEEDVKKVYSQFVHQPFLIAQHALPLLEKSRSGSILLISSICAYVPFIDIGLYSAAQTGLIGVGKAMAQALGDRRIRVNTVCLGMFEDDGAAAAWSGCSGAPQNRSAQEAEQIRGALSSGIPLGRLGRAADALGLVEFLVSDRSLYATGEVFGLTGGISVRI